MPSPDNKPGKVSSKEPAAKSGSAEASGNSRDANKSNNPTTEKNKKGGK